MGEKTQIQGMNLYATDAKGNKIEKFKVIWMGPLAFGETDSETTQKRFVELHCDSEAELQTAKEENERLTTALTEWLEYVKSYDPYASNAVSRYGMAAAGIEKAGVIQKLEEILALKDSGAPE